MFTRHVSARPGPGTRPSDKAQVSRLAEASFKQGVIQVDVTKAAADLFDDSMAKELRGR